MVCRKTFIKSSLLRAPDLAEGQLYAVVTPHPDQESFDAEVVDTKGNCYVQLSGYRTAAMPNSLDAEPLKATARRHGMNELNLLSLTIG